jgi:uncharacterized protein YkwD
MNRRIAAMLALIAVAVGSVGCQSISLLTVDGAGANASAEEHLAAIRRSAGLSVLSPDAQLEKAARQQAEFMAASGKMVHTTALGRDFLTRVRGNGIEGAAAENIAHGRFGLDGLFAAWMNSSGHRKNMLDERFTRFGLASAKAGDGERRYWALVLAK